MANEDSVTAADPTSGPVRSHYVTMEVKFECALSINITCILLWYMRIKYEQSGNLFAIKQYTVSTLVWNSLYDEMNVSANVNACVNMYANMNAAHVPLQGSRLSMNMPINLMSLFSVTRIRRYFIFLHVQNICNLSCNLK